MSDTQVSIKVLGGYRLPKPEKCPQEVHEVMLACWKHKSEERIDWKAIQQSISPIKGNQMQDSKPEASDESATYNIEVYTK